MFELIRESDLQVELDAYGKPVALINGTLKLPIPGAGTAEAAAALLAALSALGFGGSVHIYVPAAGVGPVTRNSANDATDDDEVIMGTIVVPANNGAVAGTEFIFVSLWENTNSANTKTFTAKVNGGSVGSQNTTTNPTLGQRQFFDVIDANTLTTINSFSGTGVGGNGSAPLDVTVANLGATGFTLTYTSKWATQPIAGELIRLKNCKIIQINP